MKENGEKVQVTGTVWLDKADKIFLGSDRIELLEKIQALGSITRAAKAVGVIEPSA